MKTIAPIYAALITMMCCTILKSAHLTPSFPTKSRTHKETSQQIQQRVLKEHRQKLYAELEVRKILLTDQAWYKQVKPISTTCGCASLFCPATEDRQLQTEIQEFNTIVKRLYN